MGKRIPVILFSLLCWNPITLALLLNNLWRGFCISILAVVVLVWLFKCKSLRLKVWTVNLCVLLSIAYHAELLFRSFSEKNIPNLYEIHGKYYFNRPFLEQRFATDEYVSYYRTNCQGYRIDELSNPQDSITQCDWLFIGDSFTQGAQVDYPQLFSSIAYGEFPEKVIVNAGISGAGLYDELIYFKDKGHLLNPKVVFLQIGVFNDFFNIVERKAGFQEWLTEKSDLYRYLSYNIMGHEDLPLGRWTEPFFQNQQDNIDNNILYKPSSESKEKDKQRFKHCIAEFKKEVEKSGGNLVLILIPCKEQISHDALEETLEACNLRKEDVDLMAASRLCQEVASKEHLLLIDMVDDFKSSPQSPFFHVDEHMTPIGHRLIANRIAREYSQYARRYDYISSGNKNERYPTLLKEQGILVYQSQTADNYLISEEVLEDGNKRPIWIGTRELIHPTVSPARSYLAFTEGNQDKHQTDVVLFDYATEKTVIVNGKNSGAAIPMFNHEGTQLVYAHWTTDNPNPFISVYDILSASEKYSFSDGVECWRPIFSNNDSTIYYICREKDNDHFVVKTYDVATKRKETVLRTGYEIWDISLSPSGKRMLYAGRKDNNWDLFLYDMPTKQIRQLTHTIGNEWDPTFGFSDNDVWFAGEFGINNGIYRMRIEL